MIFYPICTPGKGLSFAVFLFFFESKIFSRSLTHTFNHRQAYYPNVAQSVGGGELNDVHINANGVTNITFPFTIIYDPNQGSDQSMLADIASKCGLLGGTKQDITVNYDLALTLKVGVIPITITLPEKANFPCPIDVSTTKYVTR